jgi:Carboxymuconolactone decarboxylase family
MGGTDAGQRRLYQASCQNPAGAKRQARAEAEPGTPRPGRPSPSEAEPRRGAAEKGMAWIRTIDESDADDDLGRRYRAMVDPQHGRVDNILKVHSLHPAGLDAHFGLYRAVMRGTPTLTTAEREMIALVVSRANGCHY